MRRRLLSFGIWLIAAAAGIWASLLFAQRFGGDGPLLLLILITTAGLGIPALTRANFRRITRGVTSQGPAPIRFIGSPSQANAAAEIGDTMGYAAHWIAQDAAHGDHLRLEPGPEAAPAIDVLQAMNKAGLMSPWKRLRVGND